MLTLASLHLFLEKTLGNFHHFRSMFSHLLAHLVLSLSKLIQCMLTRSLKLACEVRNREVRHQALLMKQGNGGNTVPGFPSCSCMCQWKTTFEKEAAKESSLWKNHQEVGSALCIYGGGSSLKRNETEMRPSAPFTFGDNCSKPSYLAAESAPDCFVPAPGSMVGIQRKAK